MGWTLTHSSAGAAVELEPALADAVVLVPALGLSVMYLLNEAETRADADGWDDEDADPEGEPEPDGDPAADGDPEAPADGEAEADPAADGEAEADPAADGEADGDTDGETAADGDGAAVGELDEDGDGEGDGEGDGDGEEDGDGDGDGDGEPAAGSTSQVVSVFEDEPEIVPPRSGLSEPALAAVGEIASMPKISKLPASKLSVLARTCAKRIYIALSAQFVRLMYPLVHSEATR